uniref:6-phosphofructokinase n=1 Tax=Lygus hesperus TaxID=30085 RepID=A0A0A9YP30_LYGHE
MHDYRAHVTQSSINKNNKPNHRGSRECNNGQHDRLLPVLFLHGAYAGGREEMRYLQANKAACDAVILHPHDITMKKEFMKRLQRGRDRLRIHEEMNAMKH